MLNRLTILKTHVFFAVQASINNFSPARPHQNGLSRHQIPVTMPAEPSLKIRRNLYFVAH